MVTILQHPDTVLRKKAAVVPSELFASEKLEKIIAAMIEGLESQDDAVAIAAPQIGISYRIFVVSKTILKEKEHKVFINPTITKLGKAKKEVSEGCLSVRWQYGNVKRSITTTVRAYNMKGNEFVVSGRGLVAQIFQHEIDHLDGVLFIDKATALEEVPPPGL